MTKGRHLDIQCELRSSRCKNLWRTVGTNRVHRWISKCKYGDRTRADPFRQSVKATSIGVSGALLSGLSHTPRSGDLLWVQHRERKARFRIVWVNNSETNMKTQAAIQRLAPEKCPWPLSVPCERSRPAITGPHSIVRRGCLSLPPSLLKLIGQR